MLTYCIGKKSVLLIFQSIFRYGLMSFGNCSTIQELLILQKNVVRILANIRTLEFLQHCKQLFIELKIQILIKIYIYL